MPMQAVPVRETVTTEVSPLVKAQSEIKATYTAHMEAQKVFEEAFEKMSQLDEIAIREAEKRFRAYQAAVENSFIKREEAEEAALENYRKTLIKANIIYQDAMQRALKDCHEYVRNAGQQLNGISLSDYRVDQPTNSRSVTRVMGNVEFGYRTAKDWLNRNFRQVKNRFVRLN